MCGQHNVRASAEGNTRAAGVEGRNSTDHASAMSLSSIPLIFVLKFKEVLSSVATEKGNAERCTLCKMLQKNYGTIYPRSTNLLVESQIMFYEQTHHLVEKYMKIIVRYLLTSILRSINNYRVFHVKKIVLVSWSNSFKRTCPFYA